MELSDADRREILRIYLAESEERLAEMDRHLAALEAHPDDAEAVRAVSLFVHSLKGTSATLGFPHVAEVARAVEVVVERLRDRTVQVESAVGLLLRAARLLRRMVRDAVAGVEEVPPSHADLLRQLADAARSGKPAAGPRPPGGSRGDAD